MKTDLTVGSFIFHKEKVLLILHKKLKMWLPVGGHIEKDETPDDAIRREAKEETNLDITLFNTPSLPLIGSTIIHLATPFYVNVHNVTDHNHVGFYYLSYVKEIDKLIINKDEVLDAAWFTQSEIIGSEKVSDEVKLLVNLAYQELENHQNSQ